jgi:hypothetical protein
MTMGRAGNLRRRVFAHFHDFPGPVKTRAQAAAE